MAITKPWTGIEHQAPAPQIEIFLPSNQSTEPDFTFKPDPVAGAWSKLLGYNFTESVDDLEGMFSFAIETGEDTDKKEDIFDLICARSVVKIYEGNEIGGQKPPAAFVGIIRNCHIGIQMTSQGVRRTITFSGKSIICCITEYSVSLDSRIQDVADPIAIRNEFIDALSGEKNLGIKTFMTKAWEYFKKVSEDKGVSTDGLAEIISRFIGGGNPDNFINITGSEQKIRYNIACPFYSAGTNVIADMWRYMLPKMAYELFCYCDNGEPKIAARQVPFGDPENDYADWKNLTTYEISPISLIGYELDRSDHEVYTAFAAYIIGSARERQFYMAENQSKKDSIVAYSDKTKIYGYKLLEIDFNGYDRQGNTGGAEVDPLTEAVKKLNNLALYWYSRLDDMYSGTITLCTDFNDPQKNPRVGCRAKFLGGEFYITKAEHSWKYGSTPTIKLSAERGMVYDENGKMADGESGILKKVGKRFREMEMPDK